MWEEDQTAMTMIWYMPAINRDEAMQLVKLGLGHRTKAEAERHLADIKKPPTDPFYGQQYKVYSLNLAAAETARLKMQIQSDGSLFGKIGRLKRPRARHAVTPPPSTRPSPD